MEGMAEKEEKGPRVPLGNLALLECRENLVPTRRLQALPVPKVQLGIQGWRDLVGLKAIKDKKELGCLGSNTFVGEGPHVLVVLRWFTKALLEVAITAILVEEVNISACQTSLSSTSTRTVIKQVHIFMALSMKSEGTIRLKTT